MASLSALAFALGGSGCGRSSAHSGAASGRVAREGAEPFRDSDDSQVLGYGNAAKAAVTSAVSTLVQRYYAAAAAHDGAAACALTAPAYAAAIPGQYTQDLGTYAPPGVTDLLRGAGTCATALTRLFERLHGELSGAVTVTGVRVKGRYGYALVASPTMPASFIEIGREGAAWRIEELLGRPLP